MFAVATSSRTDGSPMRWDSEAKVWRPKLPTDEESDEEDVVTPSGRIPEPELCLDILAEDVAWYHEGVKKLNGGVFTQMISCWGVPICKFDASRRRECAIIIIVMSMKTRLQCLKFADLIGGSLAIWQSRADATDTVPTAKIKHAANVLAQWLDNDEDGLPDCYEVLERMVADDAVLVMYGPAGPAGKKKINLIFPFIIIAVAVQVWMIKLFVTFLTSSQS